jgi:hypothetical protein
MDQRWRGCGAASLATSVIVYAKRAMRQLAAGTLFGYAPGMPATYEDARRFALALPGVTEGRSYGTPSLHVGKKLMARVWEDGETLVVKTPMAGRAQLIENAPDTFYFTDHYRDYPLVLIRLWSIDQATLRKMIEAAWRMVAPAKLIRLLPENEQ